ncbi:MAG: S-methyl-5-thioribose kinase [Pseudomonadota bacterium]
MPAPPPILTADAMMAALKDRPAVLDKLGPDTAQWTITEVSDGNMNAVFRVQQGAQSVIAKHAPPFIRVIGKSWPFPQERIHHEHAALNHHQRLCPDYVPQIIDFNADQALLVTEDFRTLTIARRAFINGQSLPNFADQLSDYLARSLFFTSDFALPTTEKKALIGEFIGNAELCATTEAVIFNGPYWPAPLNRHTHGLEAQVARIRQDEEWHLATAALNEVFRTKTEALIHGDLHTGSIMVDAETTKIIDGEWAFHGPMGFDLGAVIGNLLIAYASQAGHAEQPGSAPLDRAAYAAWLLTVIEALWTQFCQKFRAFAHEKRDQRDDALLTPKLFDRAAVDRYLDQFFAGLLKDTAGFAGAKMTRRIIGISHVEDFEDISDETRRARCETHALAIARQLVVNRDDIETITDLTAAAKRLV